MKINREALEIALAEKAMNQSELAAKAKISEAMISRGINGKCEFSPKMVGKLALALGVPARDIIERKEK